MADRINETDLPRRAEVIKNETEKGQNTQQRVGRLFEDIVAYIAEKEPLWLLDTGGDGTTPTTQGGGKSVTLYYSANIDGPWNKNFIYGSHFYALVVQLDSNGNPITSTATGVRGFRIVGEKGNGADYIDYKFGRSTYASLPSNIIVPPVDPSWDSANNGWGDYPPEPTNDYPYVWMKMTFRSWQNGNYVDTTTKYTRLTGVQGPAGESSVIADFDDEMISIPVSSTGATTYFDNNVTWTTRAYLYRGTKKLAIESYTISAPGVSCIHSKGDEGDANYIQVVVSGFSDTNTDNIKIEVNLTATTGETGKCYAYINKIPSGSGSTPGEGEAALVYDLSIDTKSIKYNNDTYQPDNVVVKVRKTQGASTSFLNLSQWEDAGFTVNYAFGSKVTAPTANNKLSGNSITINSSAVGNSTMLYISLWKGSTMYDAETVHILKDGSVGNSYTLKYGRSATINNINDVKTNWRYDYTEGYDYAVEVSLNANLEIISYGTPFRIVGEKGDGAPYYTDYSFARNNSLTEGPSPTANVWSDYPPNVDSSNPYLWMRVRKMELNTTSGNYEENTSKTKVVRITGEPGPQGDMDTVLSRVTYYVIGEASQPAESAFTSTTYPSPVSPGDYIWSKTVVTYRSGNSSVSYSVSRIGADGTPEEVESFEVQYAVSESIVANPSTLNWQNEMPDVPKGSYLYTKTTITFKNSSTPIVFYSYSYQGMDGEDAAAYEFVRFSDDAKFENGVWTGHFTDVSEEAVQAAITSQGNSKNLVPNSDFDIQDEVNGTPLGWVRNNNSPAITTVEDAEGVTWVHFEVADGSNNVYGMTLNPKDKEGNNVSSAYIHITPNQDYTFSVRYKGSGQVYLGVQYYIFNETTHNWEFPDVDYNQQWESFGSEYTDGEEHLLTMNFKCTLSDHKYAKLFLVHNANVTHGGVYNFAQPKVEVGTEATPYWPAPEWDKTLLGTVHGKWIGRMRWDKPYASTVFNDYSWSRVRDAEPRMTTWRVLGEAQRPDLDNGQANDGSQYTDEYHTTFYCGAYGEPCYDMVYDGSDYWICTETYSWNETVDVAGSATGIFPGDNKNDNQLWLAHWEKAKQYNFLVAQTLVAMRAYIKLLTVDKLLTNGNNARVKIENGLITIESTEENNDTNIRFGIDENGNVLLGYYSGDTLLYELGSKGYVKYEDVVKAYFSEIPIVAVNDNDIMSARTLDIIANGNSQYRYFEGYTINSNGTKTYAISGNSEPSSANGCLYTSNTKSGANDAPTGTLTPTGYYRTKRTNSTDLNIYMGDSSVLCYYDYIYHYRSDFKTILGTPYLFTLANGDRVAQVCDKNGYPCTIQQSYESIEDERFPDMIF